MSYDKELIAGKLRRWEKYLERFWLPEWKELPDLGLYMDQVVKLLQDYLDYMPPEMKDGQIITAAAINNYVRIKVMPEPQKKRYYRVHIAYLIIICTLKQSLSIAFIQKFIPLGLSEDEVRAVYEKYALQHRKSAEYFVNQVRLAAADLLDHRLTTEMAVRETDELIAMSAVFSLVTLPVEYNASARALEWLQVSRTMQGAQLAQAREALSWAARTYLVAALSAIASVLYWVLLILGGRRD